MKKTDIVALDTLLKAWGPHKLLTFLQLCSMRFALDCSDRYKFYRDAAELLIETVFITEELRMKGVKSDSELAYTVDVVYDFEKILPTLNHFLQAKEPHETQKFWPHQAACIHLRIKQNGSNSET